MTEFEEPVEQDTERKIVRGDELLQMEVEAVPMLFEGFCPQAGLVAEVGASDTGKSMLYRQMAIAIVKGADFLNFKFSGKHKSVIFVATEDDIQATAYLLRRQNRTMRMSAEEARRIRFIYDTESVISVLRDELQREPADAVIIDAYSDVFTGKDSKDSTQTRQFLNEYSKIVKDFGCCVAFLHHTGKRTEDLAPSKNNAVGSQSFEAKMRLMFEFRADRDHDNLRHLCIVKGNYLPVEAKKASYVLRMDENFCFSPTGSRVPFDLLAKEQPKEIKAVDKSPETIERNKHLKLLREVSMSPVSKETINKAIRSEFSVSDKTARKYIEYYIEQNFLKETQNGHYPKYEFYAEELPF